MYTFSAALWFFFSTGYKNAVSLHLSIKCIINNWLIIPKVTKSKHLILFQLYLPKKTLLFMYTIYLYSVYNLKYNIGRYQVPPIKYNTIHRISRFSFPQTSNITLYTKLKGMVYANQTCATNYMYIIVEQVQNTTFHYNIGTLYYNII